MAVWLLLMIGLIITFIIIGVYFKFFSDSRGSVVIPPHSSNTFLGVVNWSKPVTVNGEVCTGYTFPTIKNKDGTISPGNPTLNASALATATKSPTAFTCVYSDQIDAILVQHTCNNIVGTSTFDPAKNPNVFSCRSADGSLVPYNTTEEYYNTCGAGGGYVATYCPGEIGAVTIGYYPNYLFGISGASPTPCLYYDPTSDTVRISASNASNLADPSFQFAIIRTNYNQIPGNSTKGPGQTGMSGTYAAIQHRSTGKFLIPASLDVNGVPIAGTGLTLGPATISNGYIWALIPQLPYYSCTGQSCAAGSKGCCTDLPCQPGGTECSCSGSKCSPNGSTAQQIVYVGNVLQDPTFDGNINFNTQSDFYTFVNKYSLKSITNPAVNTTTKTSTDTPASMQPYNTGKETQAYSSDYASMTMYNYLVVGINFSYYG